MHYINGLSEKQIQDFLVALSFVMHSDGDVSNDEKEYIKVASAAYGLDNPDFDFIMRDRKLDEVKKTISWAKEKPETARYMIREMISLALSDGNLQEEELDAVFSLGEAIGVSEDRMNDMVTWAIEGYEWQLEGFRLVEDEE